MLPQLIGFLLVGGLAVHIVQKFPFHKLWFIGKFFTDGKFLENLLDCGLCLGVWIFTFLSFILKINFILWMFDETGLIVVDQILTGMAASFVCHVFKAGWYTLYGTTMINSWSE